MEMENNGVEGIDENRNTNIETNEEFYFKTLYCLDTNIILNNHYTPWILSDNGQNLIILTETVLQELDKFKNGHEDINYQSRKFSRMMDSFDIIKIYKNGILTKKVNEETGNSLYVFIMKMNSSNNIPDYQIIETTIFTLRSYPFAKEYIDYGPENYNDSGVIKREIFYEKLIFVSNDINFRTKVFLEGSYAEPFYEEKESLSDLNLTGTFEIDGQLLNKEYLNADELVQAGIPINDDKFKKLSWFKVIDITGKPTYFIREKETIWRKWKDQNLNLFGIKPRNIEQKILWEHLRNSYNDIFVVEANAGSGKNISALACSLDMIKRGEFEGITYIRKTIISGDKQDEIGFLPGDIEEKIAGYVQPMRDAIEVIIRNKNKKKKKWSKEELEEAVLNFENEYNISYEYEGHLRGRTLKNQLIILDENQNETLSSLVTILSRIDSSCRVFVLGNLIQIDNPYLNKHNNALSFLLSQCGTFEEDIQVQGMQLTKVERGPIPEWIERVVGGGK